MPYKDKKKYNAYQIQYHKDHKELYATRRTYIDAYKATHPCVDCGESDPRCLDFDHKEGTKKRFPLASGRFRTIPTIQAEIDKCEIRCANCHRKRHHGEWKYHPPGRNRRAKIRKTYNDGL